MKKGDIPNPVWAMIGEMLGESCKSHQKLNNLFKAAGAPGEPPGNNLVTKCQLWLQRASNDASVDGLEILGTVLVSFMEGDSGFDKKGREHVETILSQNGLSYHGGQVTVDRSGSSQLITDNQRTRSMGSFTPNQASNSHEVFVVHGRNSEARDALFTFLRTIGLKPIEWNQALVGTGKASPFIGEILEQAFSRVQAIVVLFTGDDRAMLSSDLSRDSDPEHEKKLTPQARPNVLFEAGMAFGTHPDRTVLVEMGKLRPFSDIGGRHVVRINNSTQARQDLAQRLETAGCPVDLSGHDWHKAGDLDAH